MIVTIRTLNVRHSGLDQPEEKQELIGTFAACPSDGKLPEIVFDAEVKGANIDEITDGIKARYAEELKRETEREVSEEDLIVCFV